MGSNFMTRSLTMSCKGGVGLPSKDGSDSLFTHATSLYKSFYAALADFCRLSFVYHDFFANFADNTLTFVFVTELKCVILRFYSGAKIRIYFL